VLQASALPCLWPLTFVLHLKTHWAAVQSCFVRVRKYSYLSVEFCVVRAVNKCDFRLVINETPDKWRPVRQRPRSDRDSCF